ncbi:MAG: hypothetical protein CUN53_00860 [Phototrophicales bacterium]|nr:MAG: hypothetical protein CUN53_00860 [Phototrophicales bacterium]
MRLNLSRGIAVALIGICATALSLSLLTGSGVSAQFSTNTPAAPAFPTNTASPTASLSPTPSLTPSPSATLTPSPTPTEVGPFRYPEGFSPLTGLPYPSQAAAERRNLLVKISNYPPVVRPQSGVNAADVIYEYEVEGGVTRFAAIYRNNAPNHVGPVRSGRLADIELVSMYQALFAYSGASDQVTQAFRNTDWWRLMALSPSRGDNCEEAGFCRFPQEGLAFEHTLYLDTNVAWRRATARGINTGLRARGFAFSDVVDPGGAPAEAVRVDYYGQITADWQYQPQTGRYIRYTDGVPHFDAADGDQLWADNVIVIEVEHVERPDLFEPESRSASQQINLWGTGRAMLFRDGQMFQGYWERACDFRPPDGATPTPEPPPGAPERTCYSNAGTALRIFYGNNTPMMMKPGRTWVMVSRWLNYVTVSVESPDLMATAVSFTPTPAQ